MAVKASGRPLNQRRENGGGGIGASSCYSEESAKIRKTWLTGEPLEDPESPKGQFPPPPVDEVRPAVLKTDREWAKWGGGGLGDNTPPTAKCHGSLPAAGPPKAPKQSFFSGWEPGEKGLVNLVKVLEEEERRQQQGLPTSSRRESYRKNKPDEYG